MDAEAIVAIKIVGQKPMKMSFAEDNNPIKTFSAYAATEPLRIRILPWTARSTQNLLESHIPHSRLEPVSIYSIAISK